MDPMGLAVGEPGTLESFIPVWGSGRAAVNDFQNGNYEWAAFNTALAVSDVFLGKTLVEAAGKGLWKTGAHSWGATSKWLNKTGWREFDRQEMHHWPLHQNEGIGKRAPEWLKKQPWNLAGMPKDEAIHQAIHGKGRLAHMRIPYTLWYGTPDWLKLGVTSGLGHTWEYQRECQ